MNVKTKNPEDLSKILDRYSSQWVALEPETNKVVASGVQPKAVLDEARASGTKHPILTRVPKNYGTYIL